MQSTEYLEPLLGGFEACYRFLVAHRQDLADPRGPLALLEDCPIRVLFQPTWHYMMVSPAQLPVECFRDGALWEAAILSLNRNLSDDSELWSVLPAERRSMIQLDVPLFRTRSCSTDVESGVAERLSGLLPEPPLGRTRRRIEQLGDADLSLQLGLIRAAFHARVGDANHDEPAADTSSTSPAPLSPAAASFDAPAEQLVERARSIGEMLIARAIRGDDGAVTWIAVQPLAGTERFQIQPVADDLYSGRVGIAVFLAALYRVTGESRFAEIARLALSDAGPLVERGPWLGIGGTSGAPAITESSRCGRASRATPRRHRPITLPGFCPTIAAGKESAIQGSTTRAPTGWRRGIVPGRKSGSMGAAEHACYPLDWADCRVPLAGVVGVDVGRRGLPRGPRSSPGGGGRPDPALLPALRG